MFTWVFPSTPVGGEGMGDSVDKCIPFLSGKVKVKLWGMRQDPSECGFTTKPMIVFYSSPLVLGTISAG